MCLRPESPGTGYVFRSALDSAAPLQPVQIKNGFTLDTTGVPSRGRLFLLKYTARRCQWDREIHGPVSPTHPSTLRPYHIWVPIRWFSINGRRSSLDGLLYVAT